jgi:predicted glutamine amidotransferase
MCLATLTLDGATMDETSMRNAWNANPDGGGIAYFDPSGNVRAFRTLSLAKMLRGYDRLLDDGAHAMPMAIHFRYATHGTNTIANVHPFRMDDHTLAIHNGMFPIESVDGRSDTSIFVGDVLPRLGGTWMDDPHMFGLVEAYCQNGYANKLVVLTSNPSAKFRAYIVNAGAGAWNDAKTIWNSNRSWETPSKQSALSWWKRPNETWGACSAGDDDDDNDDWRECGMCGEIGVAYLDESGTDVCYICGSCASCQHEWDDCSCHGTLAHDSPLRFHAMTDAQSALFAM